jgi:hypothetical protein
MTNTKKEAAKRIDELEDLMCNTDYTTTQGAIEYEQYQRESRKMWQILDGEI